MEDQYLEIEKRVGNKIETPQEDVFLTWFLDSALYKKFHIDAQVPFFDKNGKYKYRADFVLYEFDKNRKIVVEIDGLHHFYNPEQRKYDRKRNRWFERRGYEVVRYLNNVVLECFTGSQYKLDSDNRGI